MRNTNGLWYVFAAEKYVKRCKLANQVAVRCAFHQVLNGL